MKKPDPFMTDDENPELSDADIRAMRSAAEVLGQQFMAAVRRGRGRPALERPKRKVTLRLDADVVDYYQEGGAGWQSRINEDLATKARQGRR